MRVCRSSTTTSRFVLIYTALAILLAKSALVSCVTASANSSNETSSDKVVATLRLSYPSSKNGEQQQEMTTDILAALGKEEPVLAVEKISGKLIHAKTYDQALLDKILNKSDTYYKANETTATGRHMCSCVSSNGAPGQLALIEHASPECFFLFQLDDYVRCARDLNVSALLVRRLDQLARNSMLFGSPIEVLLIQSALSEKLASRLLNNQNVMASLEATTAAVVDKPKVENGGPPSGPDPNSPGANHSLPSTSSQSHALPLSSILAIVFGVLVVILLLVGLFSVFFYMQKARLREEREKLEDLIDKLTKRAISRMETKVLKPDNEQIKLNEVCVICMENYKQKDSIRILPCGHYFHKHEIDMWMCKNHTCPVCKIDILKADIDKMTSFWYRTAVRLGLAKSPYELHEAVQTYNNYRRHFSIDSDRRYSTINQNTVTSVISTEETRSRVFSEFVNLHKNRYTLAAHNNALKNEEWPPTDGQSKRIRRLNFFGETLDDFDYNEDLAEQETVAADSTTAAATAAAVAAAAVVKYTPSAQNGENDHDQIDDNNNNNNNNNNSSSKNRNSQQSENKSVLISMSSDDAENTHNKKKMASNQEEAEAELSQLEENSTAEANHDDDNSISMLVTSSKLAVGGGH